MFKTFNHTTAAPLFLSLCGAAVAADVNLNGIVGTKALVVIDNGKPHWLAAGETSPQGVKLISVGSDSAVIVMDGRRETLTMGQSVRLGGGARPSGAQSATLWPDAQGHFVATGAINGIAVRFLVDTGATQVSLSNSEAKRLGINYIAGQKTLTATANGVVPTYKVKLDEVRFGDIVLNNVDGLVHAGDNLPIALLGMSFLNRMEMKRDGEKMVLTKRY
jgi:aspartyl protease family protein